MKGFESLVDFDQNLSDDESTQAKNVSKRSFMQNEKQSTKKKTKKRSSRKKSEGD